MTLTAAGCAAPESAAPEPSTITVVDGVRHVENHAPAWDEGRRWRLSEAPLLTLGTDTGEPQEMLTRPDALRLDNGAIVVADRGAVELRYFDENGTYLGSAGRRGEGPAEFPRIGYVFAAGDTVVVPVPSSSRITRFGPDGSFIETFELVDHGDPRYSSRPRVASVFDDGSILAYAGAQPDRETFTHRGIGPGERGWPPAGLFRFAAAGDEVVHLGEVGLVEVGFREGWSVPFEARGFVASHSRGFYYVNGRRREIEDRALDGQLRARFTTPRDPQPVTEENSDRWLQKSRENFETAGRELTPDRVAEMVFPETMPLWRNLLVDGEDNAWVERYLGLQHSQPLYWSNSTDPRFPESDSEWDVFDPEGVWLGTVELIPGRTIEQIGDDWILMSGQDEAGFDHVWLYGLIKGR